MSTERPLETLDWAWVVVCEDWDDARSVWLDGVAEWFAREFWQELEEAVPEALACLEALSASINEARASLG
jgi:hypothetical protein